jgi:purine-binding chemotaxis protein CheW
MTGNAFDLTNDDEVGLFMENLKPASQDAPDDIVDKENVEPSVLSQNMDVNKQYITFTIDQEEYGTSILKVQEIRGWMKTTPLPNMPKYVRGVTNLRGNIVPVFDLRQRFMDEETDVTDRHVVIMAQIQDRTVGMLVDAISDIVTLDISNIQDPPAEGIRAEQQYIDGLIAVGERMIALTNIDKLFDTKLIESLQENVQAS